MNILRKAKFTLVNTTVVRLSLEYVTLCNINTFFPKLIIFAFTEIIEKLPLSVKKSVCQKHWTVQGLAVLLVLVEFVQLEPEQGWVQACWAVVLLEHWTVQDLAVQLVLRALVEFVQLEAVQAEPEQGGVQACWAVVFQMY